MFGLVNVYLAEYGLKASWGAIMDTSIVDAPGSTKNRTKSRIRATVEYQFGIIKRQFGSRKVRYRGLAKNAHRLFVACALSKLVMAKRDLLKRSRMKLWATCA